MYRTNIMLLSIGIMEMSLSSSVVSGGGGGGGGFFFFLPRPGFLFKRGRGGGGC